jgi:hypothetical protein
MKFREPINHAIFMEDVLARWVVGFADKLLGLEDIAQPALSSSPAKELQSAKESQSSLPIAHDTGEDELVGGDGGCISASTSPIDFLSLTPIL